jgi:UDP-N-acetylmuramyl pentapeptide phosphotransferase/UDP-N-acetylglucosamine-1-phosphate transferase
VLEAGLFGGGVIASWALVHGIRRWASRLGLIDVPNERSMHVRPTARGGGVAIVAVCLLGLAVAGLAGVRTDLSLEAGYVLGALLVAGLSFADDLRDLPAWLRLALQAAAATILLAGVLLTAGGLSAFGSGAASWLLAAGALFFVVGLTNAYNFMDGIDGLAATQGLVAAVGWILLGLLAAEPWLGALGALVAAGCLGFLVHNLPPARIFMGDVGSAFLGFSFAFLAIAGTLRSPALGIAGTILVSPFLFDSGTTLLRRAWRRENLFAAHRGHLYQRLALAGWPARRVTGLYGLLAVLAAIAAVAWWAVPSVIAHEALLGGLAVSAGLLWSLVVLAERRSALRRPEGPGHTGTEHAG